MVDLQAAWKYIKRSIISHLFIVSTILTSGAIVNVLQVLLHLLVKPINRRLYQKLMYYVSWTWLSQSVFLLDYWSASEMIVYCDREMFESLGKTHHFALMNHGYEIDWLVGWSFLEKHSMLGFGRSFVKNVIRYIPIAGWMFGLSEQIFLQRSFDKDKQVMESGLENILSYPYSSCVIVTAEGTRMTEEKHKASVKFAQERNIQPLKHHLLPRPKGFMTCVPILKQNKPKLSVFNYQLAYDNESKVKPTLLNIIRGEKVTSHIYIENIPVDELEATPEYLHKVYQRKDELQDSFVKYGNFYEGRNLKPVTGHKYKPRIATLINSLFWFSLNFFFITYYATSLILAGRLVFLLSVSSAIIALFYIMMHNIIAQSKVKNSSSQYGK